MPFSGSYGSLFFFSCFLFLSYVGAVALGGVDERPELHREGRVALDQLVHQRVAVRQQTAVREVHVLGLLVVVAESDPGLDSSIQ